MHYKLYLAAVCEPNGGGAIGGVCQLLEQYYSKPTVTVTNPTNTND